MALSKRARWIAYGLVALGIATGATLALRPHARRAAAAAITAAPNRGLAQPDPPTLGGEIRVPVQGATIAVEIIDAASPPTATVFVLHGIRDRRDSMRGIGQAFAGRGVRAVLVDLRGHGRSTGDVLSYGVFDRVDLATVASTLDASGKIAGPIGVYGYSYGAATSIEWAGADPRIHAVVAVAPFASLRAIVPEYSPLPLPRGFIDSCVDEAGHEGGFDPDAASPLDAITKTTAPILLVHGDADERIPVAHSKQLAAAGASHAELIVVPGANHESIGGDETGTLRDRAIPWLVEHLGPPVR